ncbi:GIY-YIG nuclease family protein [Malaciobacter mytili]|uniref:GIY-YIG nuclease family protein n=1 Tax=Malaciobacter mytili TaxID=603050 RepID=UPI003BAF3412
MKHNFFLYVLVKDDNSCFKVGVSKSLHSRIRNLINYGPYDYSKSILIPNNTPKKMKQLEEEISSTFKKYNFQIKKLKKSNGETEWYHIECLYDIIKYLKEKLNHSISADINIITKDNWDNKITYMMSKEREKQKLYDEEIKKALRQYQTKKRNFEEFTKLIDKLIPLEIIGIKSIKFSNGYQYKILCKKNGKESAFLGHPKIIITDENSLNTNFICNAYHENQDYICYKINISDKKINKHWISTEFCKELNDYFYSRGYKKEIDNKLKDLLNFEIDYINSTVEYTGNKTIDNYIFNINGEFDRFLPHKMNNDFLEILYSDLDDYMKGKIDLKNYITFVLISLLIQRKYINGYDIYEDNEIEFTPNEFDCFFHNFFYTIFCEISRRHTYIENYELLTFENMLEKKENFYIEFNKDFIIDKIFLNKI